MKNNLDWDWQTLYNAVDQGHLECLQFAHIHGCHGAHHLVPTIAAARGYLNCLKWSFEMNIEMDQSAPTAAIIHGQLDCFQFIETTGQFNFPLLKLNSTIPYMVDYLILRGYDVNLNRYTPQHQLALPTPLYLMTKPKLDIWDHQLDQSEWYLAIRYLRNLDCSTIHESRMIKAKKVVDSISQCLQSLPQELQNHIINSF